MRLLLEVANSRVMSPWVERTSSTALQNRRFSTGPMGWAQRGPPYNFGVSSTPLACTKRRELVAGRTTGLLNI
jgi:hypothetical protein